MSVPLPPILAPCVAADGVAAGAMPSMVCLAKAGAGAAGGVAGGAGATPGVVCLAKAGAGAAGGVALAPGEASVGASGHVGATPCAGDPWTKVWLPAAGPTSGSPQAQHVGWPDAAGVPQRGQASMAGERVAPLTSSLAVGRFRT
jgi:hypothetical protein